MLKKLGLGRFLIYSGLLLGACTTLLGFFIYTNISTSLNALEIINNTSMQQAISNHVVLDRLTLNESMFVKFISTNSVDDLETMQKTLDKNFEEIEKQLAECKEQCLSISELVVAYKTSFKELLEKWVYTGNKAGATNYFITVLGPIYDKLLVQVDKFSNSSTEKSMAELRLAGLDFNKVKNLIILLIILVPSLFILYALILMKFLSTALGEVVEKLNLITSKIIDQVEDVKSASDSLANSVSEQAATVLETVSSVDEMNTTITRNAETSERSKGFSNDCRESAIDGREAMSEMLSSIDEMTTSNQSISSQLQKNLGEITEMVSAINQIGEKTKLINDIVFQTKLLSFNAAVEAARAGEHGKGFSVVAQEVGNLAEASGKSAQEISDMLASSSKLVNSTSDNIKKQIESILDMTKSQLTQSASKINSMQAVFDKIVEKSSLAADEMKVIALSSQEQISGIAGVSQAMGQIDVVTQRNNEAAHTSSQAANELNAQSQELLTAIDELNLVIKGRN